MAFDIPAVPEGSGVSVEMTVYHKVGIPLYSGTTEKTVTGKDDALNVKLKPLLAQRESASGSYTDTAVKIVFPYDSQPGTASGLLELNTVDSRTPSTSWDGDAIRINNSKPGLTATVYVDIEGNNLAIGTSGGAFHVNGNMGAAVNVVFCTSGGGSLSLDTKTGSSSTKIAVNFVTANFSIMEGCTAYDMRISDGAGYNFPFSDFAAFIAIAQGDNTPGHTATFKIRRD